MYRTQNKEVQIYLFNTLIFEIYSNWDYVIDLMYKYRNGFLKTISKIDAEWITFIIENNIDVTKYIEKREEFVNNFFQKIN